MNVYKVKVAKAWLKSFLKLITGGLSRSGSRWLDPARGHGGEQMLRSPQDICLHSEGPLDALFIPHPSPLLQNDMVSKSLNRGQCGFMVFCAGLLSKNLSSVLVQHSPPHQLWLFCETNEMEAFKSLTCTASLRCPWRDPSQCVCQLFNKCTDVKYLSLRWLRPFAFHPCFRWHRSGQECLGIQLRRS